MRKKMFVSFNMNSWKPVAKGMSYKKKISRFASYIAKKYNNASVIAIQEFISGGGKYIDELYDAFEKEYYVIVPPAFDYHIHSRSIVTVAVI